MLARRSSIKTEDGLEVGTTPMLIPSVSSRLNLDLPDLLDTISEIVNGPLLVSAYDYECYKGMMPDFPSLIFLDSGGYECDRDKGVSEIGFYKPEAKPWDRAMHSRVADDWNSPVPTVLISYDHPDVRISTEEQIAEAGAFFSERPRFISELLLKPETKESTIIRPELIISDVQILEPFDIIGFTEKELGNSMMERMMTVASVRRGLNDAGLDIPIHIFGSLDTVTTPLYFLAGADIFDGLSWLRFIFDRGDTLYIDSYAPLLLGPQEDIRNAWIKGVYHNTTYLKKLEMEMRRFVTTGDYSLFGPRAEFFKNTNETFLQKIGGV